MGRLRTATLFALFALFCGPMVGSAAAASGTPPSISGLPAVVGAVLTATPSVTGDAVAWAPCGTYQLTDPATATVGGYQLTSMDIGVPLCAFEIDSTSGLVDGISDPISLVGPTLNAAGSPVIQGQTLTVTPGDWGLGPTDAWQDCDSAGANCVPVNSNATGTSYTVARSDVGSTIEVQETVPGAPLSETTAPTGVVGALPPTTTSTQEVSGPAEVGQPLNAVPVGWSNQPTSYAYQWERCSGGTCVAISGATGSTYSPVAADVGDTLLVYIAGEIDPGKSYGSVGSPYPSYPTSPVVGVSTTTPPSPGSGPSPPPVIPVTNPHTSAVGRLSATMLWTFRYAPTYTQIAALAVQGPAMGSTISTACTGKGCPFGTRRVRVRALKRCRGKPHCRAPHKVNLARKFRGRHLRIGSTLTVAITRAHDIGKYYRFVVRRRRAPSVKISCLAPGSGIPGKHCSGV
jgi:hypothetical protein